jgi:hypothetical protein
MYNKFYKEAERIAQKDITDEQKVFQLNKNWDAFLTAFGDSGPRLRTLLKELNDPLTYAKHLIPPEEQNKPAEKPYVKPFIIRER